MSIKRAGVQFGSRMGYRVRRNARDKHVPAFSLECYNLPVYVYHDWVNRVTSVSSQPVAEARRTMDDAFISEAVSVTA